MRKLATIVTTIANASTNTAAASPSQGATPVAQVSVVRAAGTWSPVTQPAGTVAKAGKVGSTIAAAAAALALAPCTLDQLQAALNPLPTKKPHAPLPLLRFMEAHRGYAFTYIGGLVTWVNQ